ncbi:LacI family transcriptional regulator [Chloroflexia bacterium SDU3-3]|nr:LacI family transcriptional regulator [Chloroflexia bacterium SDU3-3]
MSKESKSVSNTNNPPDAAEPGPRRPPTSADVARSAGVSRATVSYVLNGVADSRISEETRAKVRAAADALGYTPHAMARSLRAGSSQIVLLPRYELPSSPMPVQFQEGLAARIGEKGYTVISHLDPLAQGVEAARTWASLRPVGLYVEAQRLNRRAIEILRIAGTKAILLSSEKPSRLAPTLVVNHKDVGACAAEHLIGRGHRRLAAVVPREAGIHGLGIERYTGMAKVAEQHGLAVQRIDMAYDAQQATRVVATWRAGPRPDAVLTYNDDFAMLLMRAIQDAGMAIPGDVAVIGVDDLSYCDLLRPRLTSVRLGVEHAIDVAATAFLRLIEGHEIDTSVRYLLPSVVVRESA